MNNTENTNTTMNTTNDAVVGGIADSNKSENLTEAVKAEAENQAPVVEAEAVEDVAKTPEKKETEEEKPGRFRRLGRGIVNGAKATGRAAKRAGQAISEHTPEPVKRGLEMAATGALLGASVVVGVKAGDKLTSSKK